MDDNPGPGTRSTQWDLCSENCERQKYTISNSNRLVRACVRVCVEENKINAFGVHSNIYH